MLLREDRTYLCQFISIMLLELVSTTVEVKHGDLQLTTDHHHFFFTTCGPQPKMKEIWPTTTKHAMCPPLQPVKGKGRRPQLTASQGINCHSPIPSATAKKSWYVLALRCTVKRRRCCNDVVAATPAAAAGHDRQQRERAKPAIPTFLLPQSCGNLTVHIA